MEVQPDIDDEVVILPSPQLEGPNAHIEEVIIDSSEEEETKEKPKDSSESSSDSESPIRQVGTAKKRPRRIISDDSDEENEPPPKRRRVRPQSKQEEELLKLCSRPSLDATDAARLIHLIKKKNVSINCRTSLTNETPVHLLCRYNTSETLLPCLKEMLKRRDLNLTLKSHRGHNAVTLLCRCNQHHSIIECVRMLIHRGFDSTVQDCYGRTALHLLFKYFRGKGLLELVKLFLSQGIDSTIVDKHGRTALAVLSEFYKEDDLDEVERLLVPCTEEDDDELSTSSEEDLEDDASIGSFVAEESDKTSTLSVEEEGIDLRVSSINSPDVNKISDAEAAEEDSVEVGREINDGAVSESETSDASVDSKYLEIPEEGSDELAEGETDDLIPQTQPPSVPEVVSPALKIALENQPEPFQRPPPNWHLSNQKEQKLPSFVEPMQSLPCIHPNQELIILCGRRKLNNDSIERLHNLLGDPSVNVNCIIRGSGLTPLLILCRHQYESHLNALGILLKKKGVNIHCVDKAGCSALMTVFKKLHPRRRGDKALDMAELLIASGVQVNATTEDGKTVLHIACQEVEFEVLLKTVKRLIGLGAHVGARDLQGLTALDVLNQRLMSSPVKFKDYRQVVHLLKITEIEPNPSSTKPPNNCQVNVKFLQLCNQDHSDSIAENRQASDKLMQLCSKPYLDDSSVEKLRDLLKGGRVDVNLPNNQGLTPLLLICRSPNRGQLNFLKILLKQEKININCIDKMGFNPLLTVFGFFFNGNRTRSSSIVVEMAKLLIEKGVTVNTTCPNGKNVLHIVCEQLRLIFLLPVVKFLSDSGVDIAARDRRGLKPLQMLMKRPDFCPDTVPRHWELLQLLNK